MVVRCVYIIHWIGFILTLFFFTLSILDPSGDEYLIHFTTSAMPLLIASLINSFVNKRMIYLPWKHHGVTSSPTMMDKIKPITISIK